ncbi:YgfZ/GcvT domain-containing protein [Pasteurella oralis]|uniref:CAF17-like 4Fe-4S cluster assembly/insertion protein YgfZ n=1 Tax=Pasteurella oralis TaxID=1071947 RepID=UPI000C7DB600|nr:folate-binding protein YgfZ [Pasteurella oralis]
MTYSLLTQMQDTIACDLQQYTLIEIKGEDAEKFLQGQLTCDVSQLAEGDSTLAAHCDPKGKVTSLFRLIRTEAQHFCLLIKKQLLLTTLEQLKKYAVFSKVTFTELNWHIIGLAGQQLINACDEIQAQIRIHLNSQQPRLLLLHPTSLDITTNATHSVWDLLDIQDGIPMLSTVTQGEFIPQALNLQCLENTISFQKGCYIGQEIVARAKYRGANKRAMFTFVGNSQDTPELNSEIEMQLDTHWRKTGAIINAVNFEGMLWLQVVMNNQVEAGTKFRLTEQTDLALLTLPYELA